MNCYLLLSFIIEKIILKNIRNVYNVFSSPGCEIALIIRLQSETSTGETGPKYFPGDEEIIVGSYVFLKIIIEKKYFTLRY